MTSKVVVHKVSGETLLFTNRFTNVYNVTKDIFNEIVSWGNDIVHTNSGEVDLVSKRLDLYNKTDKSISFSDFSNILKTIYIHFTNKKNPGNVYGPEFARPSTKVENDISHIDYNKLNTFIEYFIKTGLHDYSLLSFGCIETDKAGKNVDTVGQPIRMLIKKLHVMGYKFNTSGITTNEMKCVVSNVSSMLKSWKECNKSAYDNYHKEIKEIEHEMNKFSDEEKCSISDFITFCTSPIDISNPEICVIKNVNTRLGGHLKDCVIPSLKEGKLPKDLFYLNKRQEKCAYSLHTSFYTYLQNNPKLWQDNDCLILKSIYILEMVMSHEHHK